MQTPCFNNINNKVLDMFQLFTNGSGMEEFREEEILKLADMSSPNLSIKYSIYLLN